MKNRSHAVRNRSQMAFSRPRDTGPDRLPLGLQLLDRLGRLNPARRLGERLGLLAERDLLARGSRSRSSACAAKCASQRVQTSSCAALKRRHSASACARGTSAACRHCCCSSRTSPRDRLGIFERRERLHLRAELFLDADVRPALPVVGLAQLLHLRRSARSAPPSTVASTSS